MPEDYLKAHPVDKTGKIRIATKYPDYFPVMNYASNGKVREKLSFIFNNRAWPKNEKIFFELLKVRRDLARLLGFKNWADYVTVNKMTGSAQVVKKFLDQVGSITAPQSKIDYKNLLEFKRKNVPGATSLESWEWVYYENLAVKEKIGFDAREARNYFQFDAVKDGVLKTTAKLFGLSYKRNRVAAWHSDVEVYDVYRNKKKIGRFYLDLHPRDGKFGHAACYPVSSSIRNKQIPEAALVCNFSRGLMEHSEVKTFFQEFGHLIHFILGSDHEWIRFEGFRTEWDFVEAPSQMLEEWAWNLKTLQSFARHKESGKPISPELVTRMRNADRFGRGISFQRQLFFAILSLRYHTDILANPRQILVLVKREQKKYNPFKYISDTHMYASFGHLEGYSAMYYTYLWSLAIARDLFSRFKREGMYDQKVTGDYAKYVLMPGGSQDATELIENFLGRSWNLKEFEKWIRV